MFVFGSNVVGATNSNDFNVNIIDDPKSYAALLTPVDPATMGFLINSGYDPARVLFIFISRIQLFKNGTKYGDFNQDISPSHNNDAFNEAYKQFYDTLIKYINQGLSIKVDPSFVPGSGNAAHESICFDEKWIDPQRYPTLDNYRTRIKNACYNILGDNKPTDPVSTASKEQPTKTNYRFIDQENLIVEIQTRSLFGAYRFLGQILHIRDQLNELLRTRKDFAEMKETFTGSPSSDLLYINHDTAGCWVRVTYEGDQWCVPSTAIGTKRTFAILHALFHLYATPSEQPATPTVRITPG